MKLPITLSLLLSALCSFTHNRNTIDEFKNNEFGDVIKKNGDTIYGFIKIIDVFNSNKIKVVVSDEKTIKIPINEIKYISVGNNVFKPFGNSTFLGNIIDTLNTVKIYESYSLETKAAFNPSTINQPSLYYSYIIKIGNLDSEVIYDRSAGIISLNYNKQLKNIFSGKHNIIKYIDTLDKISFDDIPKTIAYINTIYK